MLPRTIVMLMILWAESLAFGQDMWTQYPDEGVGLGYGWDAGKNEKKNTACIDKAEDVRTKSQTQAATIGQVLDKQQLLSGLNISASAQAQGLFGSGSAEVNYVVSQDVHSETLTIAVHATAMNDAHYLGVPKKPDFASNMANVAGGTVPKELAYDAGLRLTPYYKKMWKDDPKRFMAECGTHYVAAIREGAELVGFLKASDLSSEEATKVHVALSGSVFGQTATSDITKTLDNLSAAKSFNIEVRKAGGWGTPLATDKDSLIRSVNNLPKDAADAPHPFQILVSSYKRLVGVDEPGDPNALALDHILTRYWRLSALHADFLEVDAHKSDYVFGWGITQDDFYKAFRQVREAVDNTRSLADKCYKTHECVQKAADLPNPYDFRPWLPLHKWWFPADNWLRSSALSAQGAVNAYNQLRNVKLQATNALFGGCGNNGDNYAGNHFFTQWSEGAWVDAVWPAIDNFDKAWKAYPEGLKDAICKVRLRWPWLSVCRDTADVDCIKEDDLRKRELAITVSAAGHQYFVNGTGARPGGEATKCDPNIHAQFDPNIDDPTIH
jgi:hypothetical protein